MRRPLPDAVYLGLLLAFFASTIVFGLSIFRVVGFFWWGFGAAVICAPTAFLVARESWDGN